MKCFIILVVLISLFNVDYSDAQKASLNLEVTMCKKSGDFSKNEKVTLVSLSHEQTQMDDYGRIYDIFYLEDSKNRRIEIKNNIDKLFTFNYDDVQDVWDSYIITDVLHYLQKKGFQNDLRREVNDESDKVLSDIKYYGLEFQDPYLLTYLYSLVYKIAPKMFIDGVRRKDINIVLSKDCLLDVRTFPNGTIVMSTGLLSALHTEDELVAVLAREIAHIVMDHTIINISKEETRQKRAEFWSAFATGVTAIAEGVAAVKNDYYMPGLATLGMAALSSDISSRVIDRMGMNFSQEQELISDQAALYILEILGYDKNALASALTRIANHYVKYNEEWNYLKLFTPSMLQDRIANVGIAQNGQNKFYEQLVSFAVTNVAAMNFYKGKFACCLELVRQNIRNHVATSDDYLLAANCLLSLLDNDDSNREVFEMIESAKAIDPGNINSYKVEILLMLRLKKYEKAIGLLENYYGVLAGKTNGESPALDTTVTQYTFEFVSREQSWAKRMLCKLKGMLAS